MSGSDRSSVPMWDSSDPERAPPPLPLPLGRSQSPTTKANTSAGIAAAAQQIIEKARESTPISSYTSNTTPQASPERSLVRGAHHKRMQSLQTGSVKDLRNYLDNNRSPERSPERPTSRSSFTTNAKDFLGSLPDRSSTPTPSSRDPLKDTPSLRPSSRPPPRPILGENTPPSSTMLALQTMQVPDDAFTEIPNRVGTPSTARVGNNYDFSSQLLNLTSIATNLQKEMASISRRSKDNATDLFSLREATLARDEDIRKSLRDLATNVSTSNLLGPPPAAGSGSRSTSIFGNNFLDSKAYNSPPSASKTWTLPRSSSVPPYVEDGRVGSPSPYSVEGAASVAMLEKIIREMVTKEGQERLLKTLSELFEKSSQDNVEAAKKVEQLAGFIKEKSESNALVPVTHSSSGAPKLDLNFDSPSTRARVKEIAAEEQKPAKNEEVLKLLQRIKDSIGHAGGATAEVKGLVRDMRGEVLGMGRELGRKLDQVSETQLNHSLDRGIEDGRDDMKTAEVQRTVQDGLAEIKDHIAGLLHQRALHNEDALKQIATTRAGPDGEEMYAAMKQALSEHQEAFTKQPPQMDVAAIDREGVLDAVKEGLKDFEPNIELQQFGLERDEILAVLKEGLEEYQNNKPETAGSGLDKGELYEMMQEALKDFQPGASPQYVQVMKEEIMADVRQALAEFNTSASGRDIGDEATRLAVLGAVREGLENHGPAAPREIEISRDDLFDAVKASLDGTSIPFNSFGEQVLQQLHELIGGMRVEFQQYSAASGRDTEQVLDAVKDGLESLRTEIESYVDRAQDVTGKDEIVDTVKTGLEQLRSDVQGYCLQGSSNEAGKAELLDYIKAEFEHLHETVGSTRDVTDIQPDRNSDVILALKEHMDELKTHVRARGIDGDDDEAREEVFEAMKEEFEQLKSTILNAHASDKSELVETIQDSMGALHSRLTGSDVSSLTGTAVEDIIHAVRQESAKLRDSIVSTIGEEDREVIVTSVKRSIDDLRTQIAADHSDASAEALGLIKEELEHFKESMGSSVVLSGGNDNNATLVALREGLEELKESTAKASGSAGISNDLLEAIHGEFEKIHSSLSQNSLRAGSNDEVIDVVRIGLDDLRSSIEKKLDSPDRNQSQQNELLDVMSEGLDTLRADVVKTLDKPLDMTVNYEILDTLKEGLTSLRAELDSLKDSKPLAAGTGEMVLAEGAVIGEVSREINPEDAHPTVPSTGIKREDLEKVEVMIAQLQIKIEAMDASIQDASLHSRSSETDETLVRKTDLENIEISLKDLQETLLVLTDKDPALSSTPGGAATKDDTDAIETLLRNTKAHLEEMVPLEGGKAATKEHVENVEGLISITNDAVESLKERIDNTTAGKTDVAVVEILVQDMKKVVEDIKEKILSEPTEEEKEQQMTKADLDILGILCTEIKTKITEMELPDPAELPSKADVEQLQGLISDFRDSHDKMKESYESDIAVTAKAFDDRKEEFVSTVQQIDEVKSALLEVKDELIEKLNDGDSGVTTLGETLKSLEEKLNTEIMTAEVQEILEIVKTEFEKAHGSMEALKLDHEQNATAALEKHGEHKEAVIGELGARMDTLFDGMMSKFDDAQAAAMENSRALEEKTVAQDALFTSTKEMADDLKLSIDTLGTALTTFTASYPDTMEKMALDTKMVYNRVDDTYNKLDETQLGLQHEHTVTRDEVNKVASAIQAVQSDLMEHNPRFMVSLKEVQALVTQHFEHSKTASDAAAQHAQAVRDLQESLKSGFEEAKGHHDSQTEALKGALPALLPAPSESTSPSYEKYDDSSLHRKLDELMDHSRQTADPGSQIERLDQIHEKVMATAAEVSAFVALQSKQISDSHETKEREVEEVAMLLERRMVQKDQIEAEITVLNEEKDSLRAAVETMRAEREALATQKSRLTADVSSLETALHIRREELHAMDAKAETIERRILEGVMNQSRVLLLSKTTRPPSPTKKKPQGRDLRVTSSTSAVSVLTNSTVPPLKANHALAMKSRPTINRSSHLPNSAERRIMSLSQINHNVPTGSSAFTTTAPSLINTGPLALKRSHSVKSGYMRKPSWTGAGKNRSLSGYNKENETLSEEDEEDDDDYGSAVDHTSTHEEFESEAGTERRTSYATGTDGGRTFDEASYVEDVTPGTDDGRRTSYGTSNLTYDTGSYMTGSELDGRTSLGSTANGMIGTESSLVGHDDIAGPSEDEHVVAGADDEGEAHDEERFMLEAPPQLHDKSVYAPPSDSGIGTDLPTAALSPSEHVGYFRA